MNNEQIEIVRETIRTWIESGKFEAEKVSKQAVDNLVKNGFCKDDKLLLDKDFDSWAETLLIGGALDMFYVHSIDENGHIKYDITERREKE